MFILRNPHRAYDTRYLLICTDDFSQKIGGKIDVHTLKTSKIDTFSSTHSHPITQDAHR